MYCPSCGTLNDAGSLFCQQCGNPISLAETIVEKPLYAQPQQAQPNVARPARTQRSTKAGLNAETISSRAFFSRHKVSLTIAVVAIFLVAVLSQILKSENNDNPSSSVETVQTSSGFTNPSTPVSCAIGGVCAVGDIGPGGGIVFYDAGSPQSWGRYMEAAPNTWNGSDGDPLAEWGCSSTSISGAKGTAIGTGAVNTAAIVAGCPDLGIAAKLADALTIGSRSDWFLPSKDELTLMYTNLYQAGVGGFATDAYWSSSDVDADFAWHQYFRNGNQFYGSKDNYGYIWPVRAFGLTSTTTTTVVVSGSCAIGGICRIGDIGPGGGIVFYDAGSPQSWGRYLEAVPNGWNGSSEEPVAEWGCYITSISGAKGTAIGTGAVNTAAIVAGCAESGVAAKLADALIFGGKSDWFLPSRDELNELCKYAKNQTTGDTAACADADSLRVGFAGGGYWSSSESSANDAWYQALDGGAQVYDDKRNRGYVRPVRAFGRI